jgi:hypothetical protein
MKLLIKQFSPTPVASSLFGSNILLSTLFPNMTNIYYLIPSYEWLLLLKLKDASFSYTAIKLSNSAWKDL